MEDVSAWHGGDTAKAADRLALRLLIRATQGRLAVAAKLTTSEPGAWFIWCSALGNSEEIGERMEVARTLLERCDRADTDVQKVLSSDDTLELVAMMFWQKEPSSDSTYEIAATT